MAAKTEPRADGNRANSDVSNTLPLTTFRTIDLGGKKNPTPLFSRFCAKTEIFFEEYSAPKSVHRNRGLRPLAQSAWPSLSRTQQESGTFPAVVVLFPASICWRDGEADFPSMLN